MTIKKRMGKRRVTDWDKVFGMKGDGKSQSSIPFATDIISKFAIPVKTTSNQNTSTGNSSSSWTAPNTNGSIPHLSQQYQNPYMPSSNDWYEPTGINYPYGVSSTPISSTPPQTQKPKHDPKELAGKTVAFATVRVQGIEHTGVLFVRRCGAWKLIDCRTMNKVASGTENSPLPDVSIHYIIYSDETDKKPKPKSRFDDIGMRDVESDTDGNTAVKK